jgi:hypothetical protein
MIRSFPFLDLLKALFAAGPHGLIRCRLSGGLRLLLASPIARALLLKSLDGGMILSSEPVVTEGNPRTDTRDDEKPRPPEYGEW